jgi:hypothetical protein
VQKIHEATNGGGLNAEQQRNGLPLFGALVAGQRAHTPRADNVRRQLKPMLPRRQWQERPTIEVDEHRVRCREV